MRMVFPRWPDADRKALFDFQQKLARLYGAVQGSVKSANELKAHLKEVSEALKLAPSADPALLESADRLTHQADDCSACCTAICSTRPQ